MSASCFSAGHRRYNKAQEDRLWWDSCVYESGELLVVTHKDGKAWTNATVRTVGPAAQAVPLTADRNAIRMANDWWLLTPSAMYTTA